MAPARILALAFAALLAGPALVPPAAADDRGQRHGHKDKAPRHGTWHGGDIHRFHQRDIHVWRGGHWFRGPHAGRHGWWWIVGGVWYFYPVPVYPYPDPFEPPMVAAPPPPAAPQYWYYCADPPGYYPYVAQCPAGWQRVPASPPG